MILHRRQLPRRPAVRRSISKPDICNPLTAGSPDCREPNGEPTQAGGDRRRGDLQRRLVQVTGLSGDGQRQSTTARLRLKSGRSAVRPAPDHPSSPANLCPCTAEMSSVESSHCCPLVPVPTLGHPLRADAWCTYGARPPSRCTAQGSAVAQQPMCCGTRPLRPEANTLRRVPG